MARYAYLVIQDETTWPVKDRNDVQRHVLGVHASEMKARIHLMSCVISRKEMGFTQLRATEFEYDKKRPQDTKVFEHYLCNDDTEVTCGLEIHRCRF